VHLPRSGASTLRAVGGAAVKEQAAPARAQGAPRSPLAERCAGHGGVRLGVIEVTRVLGFFAMIAGMALGAVGVGVGLDTGRWWLALGGMLVAALSSCFDLFGEAALVRLLARRLESRPGSVLRASPSNSALVNVEPAATVQRVKRVPDEVALLELVPRSGRLALEGVGGRAEVRAEHRPVITARRDQPFPVVSLRYFEGERHFDLVLYQQPSFVRFFAVMLGLLRIVRHPSERLAERMRVSLEGVQLPGRNVPERAAAEGGSSVANAAARRN
jgi:plasmid stabilization system protein ParE